MTKKYFFISCLLISFFYGFSQDISVLKNNSTEIELEYSLTGFTSVKKNINSVWYESFNHVSNILMMEKDNPELPVFRKSIQLPLTGNFTIAVTGGTYTEYENTNILPSKGSLKRNINPNDVPYIFGESYTTNDFYPMNIAEVGKPFILRNTRGAIVSFYPYQYNTVSKKLRVYNTVNIKVIINESEDGKNQISSQKLVENKEFNTIYKNLYANYSQPQYTQLYDAGELLIITPPGYVNAIQPLVNWKIEKGIKTTVSTLQLGGNNSTSIKNHIQNFYSQNPNLVYVLLIGDHENLPSYTYGITGAQEQLWSDSFYGQLDGTDMFPEIIVSRLSGNVTDIQNIVAKTLEYETNPLQGNWMTNAIGIGSNEGDGFGDDGEADWQHLRNIGTQLTNFGYNQIYEFYDGFHQGNDLEEEPNPEMISTAINQGVGLLNYTGHGWTGGVSTGNYTNESVDNLENTGAYPFVVSVACNNGTFVGNTSLCESFLRTTHADQPVGAIASCGSSILMAWAEPMQTQDEMTELIVRSNSDNIKTTLGGLFYNSQISMLEAYNQSITAEEIMQTWVFFGDASTQFRSKETQNISANHAAEIPMSGTTLEIASNTNGAIISITQDNVIIALSEIVNGLANVEIPALTSPNPLKITLSKENAKPYRGELAVTTLSVNDFNTHFSVYPNPTNDFVTIENKGFNFENLNISVTDINGRIVKQETNINLSTFHTINLSAVSTGLYFVKISNNNLNEVIKIQKK